MMMPWTAFSRNLLLCKHAFIRSHLSWHYTTFLSSLGAGVFDQMRNDYLKLNESCVDDEQKQVDVNPQAVFVNNELHLKKLSVYGFDFDHTLVRYTDALNRFIFEEARNYLVTSMSYPDELMDMDYDPDFAIRGLHLDVKRGYLMKVDSFHNIQLDTVHHGLTPVPVEQILKAYNGTYLPSSSLKQMVAPDQLSQSSRAMMLQLMDMFSLAEFYLLACVIECFQRRHLVNEPFHIYRDVSKAVYRVHQYGAMKRAIMEYPEIYIEKDPDLHRFLEQLLTNNKRLFLISNSSPSFIDRGMNYAVGSNWRNFFHVIISRARKPEFFRSGSSEFRQTFKNWEGVKSFNRGDLYEEGNLMHLMDLTKWHPQDILYFGDHVYSDLADVANTQGWTTAAVIPELHYEIAVNNTPTVRSHTNRLKKLEELVYKHQHATSPEARVLLSSWEEERNELRYKSKVSFNKYFGSIFRSFHNPSYFSRRLSQYAVLYTSKVTNLLQYPLDHIFYPKRAALPHEP